jgi:hypothetical protein
LLSKLFKKAISIESLVEFEQLIEESWAYSRNPIFFWW